MISFNVKSPFKNVPLDKTIDIIIKKVYEERKIKINIPKTVLKQLLCLCTKYLHFTFNDEIYTQIDSVAMGSPLGSLLANIFMISLEENVIMCLSLSLCNYKRYVDDTHAYVDPAKVDMILNNSSKHQIYI